MSRIFFGAPEAIEDELRGAGADERRMIVAHAARSLVRSVDVSPAEATFAMVSVVSRRPPRKPSVELAENLAREIGTLLATDARRSQLREAVAELARTRADELPLLAEALGELLAEGQPTDPARDELWTNFAIGAVQAYGG